jgi:hypothetical protein
MSFQEKVITSNDKKGIFSGCRISEIPLLIEQLIHIFPGF